MNHVTVIAEPGCTAEGDHFTMLELIRVARDCGADVFKAQWVSNVDRMVARRHAEDYRQCYQWLAFEPELHAVFRTTCGRLGMQYACSVYLPEDVAIVAPYVDFLKISSFEADDTALVYAAKQSGIPVVVSHGMRPLMNWHGVTRLHCTSSYPAPVDSLNLALLREDYYHGLSDHSRDVLTGAVAVGAGAKILEAHYRLDSCDPSNPDYPVSFGPAEFTQYIQNVRKAERMMGDGIKKIEPCEEPLLRYKVTG